MYGQDLWRSSSSSGSEEFDPVDRADYLSNIHFEFTFRPLIDDIRQQSNVGLINAENTPHSLIVHNVANIQEVMSEFLTTGNVKVQPDLTLLRKEVRCRNIADNEEMDFPKGKEPSQKDVGPELVSGVTEICPKPVIECNSFREWKQLSEQQREEFVSNLNLEERSSLCSRFPDYPRFSGEYWEFLDHCYCDTCRETGADINSGSMYPF